MYEEGFMQRAIEISTRALDEPGTEPFGAVIVRDGRIVGEGLNHALAHFDPTSHGEIEAIRDACRRLECIDLTGCELYTSCEPCALCVAAITVAGIGQMYYAASMAEAGEAFHALTPADRHAVDPEFVRAEAGAPVGARALRSSSHLNRPATAILRRWAELKSRRGGSPAED